MPGDGVASIVCVVVNWNGWQDTLACLEALAGQDYARLGVVVVENGSTDDSAARIRAAYPAATLVETRKNLGFAAGCNVGIRTAYAQGAEYIWVLNNDTVAPPDTASKLAAVARATPRAGIIGSVLYYAHDPAQVQAWGGGKVNLWTGFVSHVTAPASFAGATTFFTGASVMLPRRVCEEVGILSEAYFMYSDDADLSLRIHKTGYPLVMAEETAILHKEGASSPKRSPLIDEYTTISTLRLLERHAPMPVVSMAIYLALRVGNRALQGRWANVAAVGRAVGRFRNERGRVFSESL